jgi:long-chain acyl-CoA synthetase
VKKSLEPYPNEPLFTILENTAEKSGKLPYTKFMGTTTTYAETNDTANRVANFLIKKGIKKGDKVAIFLPNTPHYPIIFFGILKAGAVAVTCNPQYTTEELNFQLKDSEAVMVFVFNHKRFTPSAYKAIEGTQVKYVVVCSVKDYLSKLKGILGGLLGKFPKKPLIPSNKEDMSTLYKDIRESFEPEKPKVDINPDEDLAMLIYTGGTTGVPKGVMLSHKNLYSYILQIY